MVDVLTDQKFNTREELARRFRDRRFVEAAIGKATWHAVLRHKALGNPIAEWRHGDVVIVQPADIDVNRADLDDEAGELF